MNGINPIRNCLKVVNLLVLPSTLMVFSLHADDVLESDTYSRPIRVESSGHAKSQVAPPENGNKDQKAKAIPDKSTKKEDKEPPDDPKGKTPPEYKRPSRWGLTAGGSQRYDWLAKKERFRLHEELNAKKVLGMPEWLDGSLEQRTRYETYDTPWRRGQKTGEDQIPLQTVLWLEAHKDQFRAGFEFWNAVQSGAEKGWWLNNTMVNPGNFTQLYAAWTEHNLFDSDLGFEAKGGRMTLDLGSRRLVARNNFRNTTNSFTGLELRFMDPVDKWHLLAFATQPITRLPNSNDNDQLLNNDWVWNREQSGSVFAGAMLDTWALPWAINAELYLYYLYTQDNREGQPSALDRELVTPGMRIHRAARKAELDFEVETVGQTGQVNTNYNIGGVAGKRPMNAQSWFEHVQIGYTFDAPLDPRILLQYDYASGGNDGNTTHSFDALFGAKRWEYGPTGIFGPFARNNLSSPGTRLFLVPHRDLTTFVAYRAYWLADAKAPWVNANLWDPTGRSGNFIGQTVEVAVRWDAHENLAFEVGWEILVKGEFAKNAPGAPTDLNNVNYTFVQSEIRF